MNINFEEITLPAFLWYILPGLNFIGVDVFFPLVLLQPSSLAALKSLGGAVGVFAAALVAGFIMDSLKLYRFSLGYKASRQNFFAAIAKELQMSSEDAESIFDAIRLAIREKGALGKAVAFDHSRWVMVNLTSKCFYFLGTIWLIVAALVWTTQLEVLVLHRISPMSTGIQVSVCLAIALGSIVIGFRLAGVATHHRDLANRKYLLFLRSNRDHFIQELLTPDNVASDAG